MAKITLMKMIECTAGDFLLHLTTKKMPTSQPESLLDEAFLEQLIWSAFFSFWYGTWEGGQLEKTPSIIIYDSIDNLSGVDTEPIKHLCQLASFFLELVRL